MFIFISHNVLTEKESPHGYHLLCCLRAYLDLTMWEGLDVHTEETIESGRKAVKRLGKLLNVSDFPRNAIFIDLYKAHINKLEAEEIYINFDFPKLHAQTHVFDDIEQKGVLRNYSTRLFERLHGPLKTWYQRRTNFKNVAHQVSQFF